MDVYNSWDYSRGNNPSGVDNFGYSPLPRAIIVYYQFNCLNNIESLIKKSSWTFSFSYFKNLFFKGLRELQQIPREPDKKPYRDVLS
jgi:hypothetical protein